MQRLLCPSMMCADAGNLAAETRALDAAGADVFHCDIMDGVFVPNITLGLCDVKAVRANTQKPVDCHLMVSHPQDKVDWFIDAGADILYLHPEAGDDTAAVLRHVADRGVSPGIAVNPETDVAAILPLLPFCRYVMAMTVHPGFAGQKFIPEVRDKVLVLAELKQTFGYRLMIDGACSPAVIRDLSSVGADGFVLGTSALFGKPEGYAAILQKLHGE